ncbi:MAG: TonB-dependent receptor [Candidatus Kryptonium sp.]|nr:TonB-dependent receptor [Candidatus Kryptonium sp.]
MRTFTTLVALILFFSYLIFAQGSGTYTASVTGKIVDNEGKPIPDVEVIAKNVETGFIRGAITTAAGIYNILSVPPGTYEISALHVAYGKQTKIVELGVGERVTVNFSLVPKEIQVEEVVVVAEAREYEVKKTELSTPLRPQQISELPINTRNFLELTALVPGLKPIGATFGSGSLQPTWIGFYFEGTEFKNEIVEGGLAGQFLSAGNPFPLDAVKEARAITQLYKAEYAKAAGGVITAVSKTGTNEFHGTAFVTYRDKSLNTRGPFETTKPNFKRFQTGVSLGGPIVRDKLHFFVSYERTSIDKFATVVTGERFAQYRGTFKVPFAGHVGLARLTFQPAINHYFDFTYYGRFDRDIIGVGGLSAYERGRIFYNRVYNYVLKHQFIISPNLMNEARVNFQRYNWEIANISPFPTPGRVYPSALIGAFSHAPQNWFQDRYAFYNDITYTTGNHVIKAGISIQRLRYEANQKLFLHPIFYFRTDADATPYQARVGVGIPTVEKWNTQIGLYLQDDWNVTPYLTLNIGIRWDYESNMINNDFAVPDTIRRDLIGFFGPKYFSSGKDRKPYLKAFQPRFGISYDISKEGKTVIFGGAGVYYDRHVWNVASDEILRYTWKVYYIDFPPVPWDDKYYNRDSLLTLIARGRVPSPEIFLIPNDLKPPMTIQFSIGLRQRFGDVVTSISYTGVRGYNGITTYNANWRNNLTTKYGPIQVWTDAGNSWYDAIYFTLDKPYKPGSFGLNIAYTVSWTYDEFDNTIYYGYTNYTNPNMLTKAFSTLDERHRISINGIIGLPFGFKLSGWGTFATGRPYLVITGNDDNRDGVLGNDYPAGLGRNAGRVPGQRFIAKYVFAERNFNLRLSKDFSYRGVTLTLMVEAFNVFNWTNFGGYVGNMRSALFGKPTTAGAPRQVQLGTRISF